MPNQAHAAGGRTGACGEHEVGPAATEALPFSTMKSDVLFFFMKALTRGFDIFYEKISISNMC